MGKGIEEGLREHELLPEEFTDVIEGGPEDLVGVLRKFSPGEYYSKGFIQTKTATNRMINYVERLRDAGLDIGKGNAEFGYKMPLQNKDDVERRLVIFRRR